MRRPTQLHAAVGLAIVAMVLGGCGSSGSHSTTAALRAVSGPLVGVVFGGPALASDVDLNRELATTVASGAESLRIVVAWSQLQPYRTQAQVPAAARSQFVDAGGVPTRFGALDRVVGAAASHGLSLLPTVEYSPAWDALHPGAAGSPPASPAPYAAFLTALVGRYGPAGSFWRTHPGLPRVPIRMWQIWNEPHFVSYWSDQPFAPGYVKLLAAAHAALKAADPEAQVVLAGLADFSWTYLAQIYSVPGARRLFDVVALHPYTARPAGVIEIMRRARSVMDRFGDAMKPILATEITWPSSLGKAPAQFGVATTEDQQARRLDQLMPLLIANRARLRLRGFYWYTWIGDETPRPNPDGFDYAGLEKYVHGTITAKPVLSTFRRWALVIAGCQAKATPTRCRG